MDDKVEEVAAKYDLPLDILKKAIDLERASVTLQNRRMTPRLRALLSEYIDADANEEVDVEAPDH